MNTPAFDVAVLMRREAIEGAMARWQSHRWVLHDVVADEGAWGKQPKPLRTDAQLTLWAHPGFRAELHRDDAEGYYLNVTSPAPCWFVMWRMDQIEGCDEPIAVPQIVSLSYHDAGRWLDAQETVEQVPAPAEVLSAMRAFALAHWAPEPKKRQRPQSFQPLTDRFGHPARVSTGKPHGSQ
ncbi:MAG: DUF3305 domain-containing protein [Alphaproteobacteria bacterium]|nr:DUF3305 domain-containing protein [Alphaproteobacteria bacterium]